MKQLLNSIGLTLLLLLMAGCGGHGTDQDEANKNKKVVVQTVQMDVHIMSKCPFGSKVVNTMLPVIEKLGDNIDFRLHYIGREQNGELKSMHGIEEVQGDKLQLCAHKLGDTRAWLSFLKCQNEDWRQIPKGWEKCAKTAKLDVAAMKRCSEGDDGESLLKASFAYSATKGAKGSPTIFLAGQSYTGGRTEASLGRSICAQFKDSKPDYCANIPEPVRVPVTVVSDKRCKGHTCNPRRFLSFVRNTFEGAEITELDYSDPDGKALYEKSGQQFLPIAVFGKSVEKVETGFNRLQRRFERMKNGDYVYPLGKNGRPQWDPTAEVCDDAKDNTGNGKVDCADESCKGKKVCRQEVRNKLDLFIMSQCPYGIRTVNAMAPVLEHFENDRSQIDFTIHYIGTQREGVLSSMHGQNEVNEDLRQVCAQRHYSRNYKFMEYVLCRNEAYQKSHGHEDADAWKTCAKGGIQAAIIQKCAESEEGAALLSESFQMAADLNITGSPSWLLNNRYDMRARASVQIQQQFCQKNSDLKACAETIENQSADAPLPVPADSCGGRPAPTATAPAPGSPAAQNNIKL